MQAARPEWRAALGIPPTAPPQAVIDQLYAASRALRAGDPARAASALPQSLFPAGGRATLDRLAALPPLPRTAAATAYAERALLRSDSDRGLVPARSIGGGVRLR